MLKSFFIFIFFSPLLLIGQCNLDITNKDGPYRQKKRVKVVFYHDNGAVAEKGVKKRYFEYLGCLGKWPVYKREGRWKYYDEEGELEKIVVYKKDKKIRVAQRKS